MNPLLKYLQDKGLRNDAFAWRIGINPTQLSYLIHDHRKPSLKTAIKIHKETNGDVSVFDWELDKEKNQSREKCHTKKKDHNNS